MHGANCTGHAVDRRAVLADLHAGRRAPTPAGRGTQREPALAVGAGRCRLDEPSPMRAGLPRGMNPVRTMLGIDLALLAAAGVVLVGLGAWLGGRLGERSTTRQRRLQGARNAAAEQRRLAERCAACDEPVDPATDVLEAGRWWHIGCYRNLVQ